MKITEITPFKFARISASQIRNLASTLDKYTEKRLWLKILIGMFLGMGLGYLLGPDFNFISEEQAGYIGSYLAIPGQVFLSLIQLVVIPMVFASVILGIVGGESLEKLKSMGARIGLYFVITTGVSVAIGFLVSYLIQPGSLVDVSSIGLDTKIEVDPSLDNSLSVLSFFSNLIPNNFFQVLATGEMLQVVLLAMFLGVALMSLSDDEAKPLISLLNTFQKLSMVIIGWAMKLAPIAVFGLSAQLFLKLGIQALLGLSGYLVSVLIGLLLLICFYLLLVKFVAKRPVGNFLANLRELQLLAFSTSSSASVMPLSIETAERKLGVRPSVSQFVVPLGTTINMDGTALYQGVATLFLAQVYQVDLGFGQLFLVVITATLSSIGAPGTPGVGMAVLASILSGVGIPAGGVFLIMGVDRLLDMCRTVVNVTGDITAALVMDRWMDR